MLLFGLQLTGKCMCFSIFKNGDSFLKINTDSRIHAASDRLVASELYQFHYLSIRPFSEISTKWGMDRCYKNNNFKITLLRILVFINLSVFSTQWVFNLHLQIFLMRLKRIPLLLNGCLEILYFS
jgi:hypothetical protein